MAKVVAIGAYLAGLLLLYLAVSWSAGFGVFLVVFGLELFRESEARE